MTLRRPAADDRAGPLHRLRPADAGWTWTSLDVERLAPGARAVRPGDGEEVLVLVLEGTASVRAGAAVFEAVGGRASVFEDRAAGVVLVAPGDDVEVTATGVSSGDSEMTGRCSSPVRSCSRRSMTSSKRFACNVSIGSGNGSAKNDANIDHNITGGAVIHGGDATGVGNASYTDIAQAMRIRFNW